ncbi:MAG: MotA/TolQ/ExbB proton channel family protein [Kiritimatiellia bacterium]
MNRFVRPAALLLVLLASAVRAQAPADAAARVEAALLQTRADVEAASAELTGLREKNAAARKPLAARLEALQREVGGLRETVRRNHELVQRGGREREELAAELARRGEESRYIDGLVSEYRRAMETRMSGSEAAAEQAVLKELDAALADGGRPGVVLARLLSSGLERAQRRLGGHRFAGVVLDGTGRELPGALAALGPLVYFASADGSRAGLAGSTFGQARPTLEERLPEGASAAIAALVRGGEAVVPVDVTGGDAVKVERSRMTLPEYLRKGGFVMVPLGLVAVLALVLTGLKWLDLARLRMADDARARELLECIRSDNPAEARAVAARAAEPLRSVFTGIATCHRLPREQLEEILHESILGFTPRLERHLGMLAVLGGIAPLLGLLGTVTGMIHTFQLVTIFGTGDAKLLSGGISEALITTEAGLIIAIPVLLVHALLSRQARGRLVELEQTALGLVNELKARETE